MERLMDPYLYRAAELGNWDVIQQYEHQLHTQETPNKDTVLHVLSRSCDSSFAVQQILGRNPKLLLKLNADMETPLHIAARKGHTDIVRAVVDCIKRHDKCRPVLRSRNRYANIALHEAIKNNRREIIQLLVEEDPTLVYITNGFQKSPLHLAAENGDEGVVALILSHKPVTDSSRTTLYIARDGRNALHAAAIGNFPECLKLIVRELPSLAEETDKFGWNALHYAARFNHQEVARQILLSGSCRGQNKALRIAAIWGHIEVMEELLMHCPDCWSTVTRTEKNAIHLAVENEQQEVLNFMLRKSWASELVNGKDQNGNTPLHFFVTTKRLLGCELVNHPAIERNALNKAALTPLDELKYAAHQDQKRKDFLRSELEKSGALQSQFITSKEKDTDTDQSEENLNTMAETYQVVATLIVAISFAAGFTIPGGYESNEGPTKGLPVFLNKAAFIAFIIFDFAALMLSWIALLGLLLHPHIKDHKLRFINLAECGYALILSLVALLLSFGTGLYITLPNLGIRISLLIFAFLGCIPFTSIPFLMKRRKLHMYSNLKYYLNYDVIYE